MNINKAFGEPTRSYFANNQSNDSQFFKVEEKDIFDYEIKGHEQTLVSSIKRGKSGSGISRKESAKNSTAKYREKKKQQLNELELYVKQLESQLVEVDNDVHNMKKKIMVGLETLSKMNQLSSNENIEIYREMEVIIGKNDPQTVNLNSSTYPILQDFDKINLLLDTLKYRIGASGRERQCKLAYHFKSIVNTMFPALYRYLLICCMKKLDIFSNDEPKSAEWQWTNLLCEKIQLTDEQKDNLQNYSNRLQCVFRRTIDGIAQLDKIKEKLRLEGIQMEGVEDQIRDILNPIQSAHWTIFSEKNKYRKQLLLDAPFFHGDSEALDNNDDSVFEYGIKGHKKVKLSP